MLVLRRLAVMLSDFELHKIVVRVLQTLLCRRPSPLADSDGFSSAIKVDERPRARGVAIFRRRGHRGRRRNHLVVLIQINIFKISNTV